MTSVMSQNAVVPTASTPIKATKVASKSKRKSSSLPHDTVEYLKAWMMSPEHIAHPYPTEQEKAQIMADTGIELKQLTNWFVNNRKRYWKPRVEARLQQQAEAAAAAAHAHAAAVAAVTAAAHTTNPVTPDCSRRPTLTLSAGPVGGFVNFDVALPRKVSTNSLPVMESNFVQILASPAQNRVVSETSSAASVSGSEDDHSVTASEGSQASSSSFAKRIADAAKKQEETEAQAPQDADSTPAQYSGESPAEKPKRSPAKRIQRDSHIQTPRKKFRRVSMELWRDACQEASDIYDVNLPTLEEAARLFGYAR